MDVSLDTPLQFLKGVGPKRAEALALSGLSTARDLLFYFPRRYLDRTRITEIGDLQHGVESTIKGEIVASGMHRGRTPRFEATLRDDSGQIYLVFFRQPRWFQRVLKKNVQVACTGIANIYGFELQMVHPEFELLDSDESELGPDRGRIVPMYPGSGELSTRQIESRFFRKLILPLVQSDLVDQVTDPLPRTMRSELDLLPTSAALRQIHFPDTLESAETARRRFAFDELLAIQIMLALKRSSMSALVKPHRYEPSDTCRQELTDALPFTLTSDQASSVEQILADMAAGVPMQRLLQGDVGAGKTVVAAFALHVCVRSGLQAAIMAPTEILAEQHFATLSRLLEPLGTQPTLLTGSMPAATRKEILARLEAGEIGLVVGTHILISESARFHRLALAVVDEQHRFGVLQRSGLAGKGELTDMLVMTATPIPRTLQLTLYGDLDVSSIRQLPPGRTPVTTRVIADNDRSKMWRWLRDRLAKGDQAYVVYPIIEESEKQDLKAATSEFEMLKSSVLSDYRLALVHGRTPALVRRNTMQAFRDGQIDLLVATTIIEIGVDVANANIMIIEHAERFGLSQLHQLRGRIRRGTKRSYCIAVTPGHSNPLTQERLDHFARTDDGFEIAEADLRLRGPGDLIGARQHGMPILRAAHPAADLDLLEVAREQARLICLADPFLKADHWSALREAAEESSKLWAAG
jgi:ATP-dependent DNA helicase RecG